MTRKEQFNEVFQTALAQKQGIKVEITSPDMPLNEIIVNPPENVSYKIEYYNAAYDDEMKLKHNPKIMMMNPSVEHYSKMVTKEIEMIDGTIEMVTYKQVF